MIVGVLCFVNAVRQICCFEVVSVNCPGSKYIRTFSSLFAVGQINDGAVILWRDGGSSVHYTSGIVEVHITGLIGNVCHGGTWAQAEADTVCRQLGYNGASGFGVAGDGAR